MCPPSFSGCLDKLTPIHWWSCSASHVFPHQDTSAYTWIRGWLSAYHLHSPYIASTVHPDLLNICVYNTSTIKDVLAELASLIWVSSPSTAGVTQGEKTKRKGWQKHTPAVMWWHFRGPAAAMLQRRTAPGDTEWLEDVFATGAPTTNLKEGKRGI